MISPPVVKLSAQRRDPIPESLVFVTVMTSPRLALGLSGAEKVGTVGSSAQAPRTASVMASGQRPARDANDCMTGSMRVWFGCVRLGAIRRAVEPRGLSRHAPIPRTTAGATHRLLLDLRSLRALSSLFVTSPTTLPPSVAAMGDVRESHHSLGVARTRRLMRTNTIG